MATCPNGHDTTASDYCDVCGAPLPGGDAGPPDAAIPDGAPAASAPSSTASPAPAPAQQECPNCHTLNTPAALFCEACGYDFTTGAMPRPAEGTGALDLDAPAPAPAAMPDQGLSGELTDGWVAEVWVDPDWYAAQESEDVCPSPGLPEVVPLRLQSLLVGRPSASRNIHPDLDLTGDPGVSRRQAQLTSDGSRWWVEDLQSSNGTYVGPASGPLPTEALPPGQRREVAEGDRIYLGAWTRLVVRRATPEEQAG